jgi:hypothetical protein
MLYINTINTLRSLAGLKRPVCICLLIKIFVMMLNITSNMNKKQCIGYRWVWKAMPYDILCDVLTYLMTGEGCVLVGTLFRDVTKRHEMVQLLLLWKSSVLSYMMPLANLDSLYSFNEWEKRLVANRCNRLVPTTCVMCAKTPTVQRLCVCKKTGVVICVDCRENKFLPARNLCGPIAIKNIHHLMSLQLGIWRTQTYYVYWDIATMLGRSWTHNTRLLIPKGSIFMNLVANSPSLASDITMLTASYVQVLTGWDGWAVPFGIFKEFSCPADILQLVGESWVEDEVKRDRIYDYTNQVTDEMRPYIFCPQANVDALARDDNDRRMRLADIQAVLLLQDEKSPEEDWIVMRKQQ